MARRLGLVGVGVLLGGCYAMQPTGGVVPAPGTMMAFDITDAGRLALGGLIGPEIGRVEGRLLGTDSTEYTVGVTLVELLRGGEQVWHGETVHLKKAYVSSLYERRFSRARSVAFGVVGAGVIAAIAGRSIAGFGDPSRPDVPPDTGQTLRRPRP